MISEKKEKQRDEIPFFHRLFIIFFVTLLLFPVSCGTEMKTTAEAVPNDLGEKAYTSIPRLKRDKRNEDTAFLSVVQVEDNQRDQWPYLLGEKGSMEYLYYKNDPKSVSEIPGVQFSADENKIVLNNFKGEFAALYAYDMGTDLHLEIHVTCELNFIQIDHGGLWISGDGELTVKSTFNGPGLFINSIDYYAYLIIEGNVKISVGTYIYPHTAPTHQLIVVHSKQYDNFYYLAPLQMSNGRKREKTPVLVGDQGTTIKKTAYETIVKGDPEFTEGDEFVIIE